VLGGCADALLCGLLCRYKSVLVSNKWMLKGVTGECNSDELPSHPSPSFPPEAVVEAQLAALRCVWQGAVAHMFCAACTQPQALVSAMSCLQRRGCKHHAAGWPVLCRHKTWRQDYADPQLCCGCVAGRAVLHPCLHMRLPRTRQPQDLWSALLSCCGSTLPTHL
jgi:hypothetical protein